MTFFIVGVVSSSVQAGSGWAHREHDIFYPGGSQLFGPGFGTGKQGSTVFLQVFSPKVCEYCAYHKMRLWILLLFTWILWIPDLFNKKNRGISFWE